MSCEILNGNLEYKCLVKSEPHNFIVSKEESSNICNSTYCPAIDQLKLSERGAKLEINCSYSLGILETCQLTAKLCLSIIDANRTEGFAREYCDEFIANKLHDSNEKTWISWTISQVNGLHAKSGEFK